MIAIIQARTSSQRLKNKVMIEIKGKPMISYVIKSIKKSKMIKKLVIATYNKKSDDHLAQYLKRNFTNIYRGSLRNVANECIMQQKNLMQTILLELVETAHF